MKTKIYEARKQHVEIRKSKFQHIQLQAFIERIQSWMSSEEAINTPRSTPWEKYKNSFIKKNIDLYYVKEVIGRMQQDGIPVTTPAEREQLCFIKNKYWLPMNTSLFKLLSFLKNAHHTPTKTPEEE